GARGCVDGGYGVMQTLWDQTLVELRSSLSAQEYTAWIACLRSSDTLDDALAVEAPSVFHRNWIQRHFLERIRSTATHVAGHPVAVSVSVGVGIPLPMTPPSSSPIPVIQKSAVPGHQSFSFDTFVVGQC